MFFMHYNVLFYPLRSYNITFIRPNPRGMSMITARHLDVTSFTSVLESIQSTNTLTTDMRPPTYLTCSFILLDASFDVIQTALMPWRTPLGPSLFSGDHRRTYLLCTCILTGDAMFEFYKSILLPNHYCPSLIVYSIFILLVFTIIFFIFPAHSSYFSFGSNETSLIVVTTKGHQLLPRSIE